MKRTIILFLVFLFSVSLSVFPQTNLNDSTDSDDEPVYGKIRRHTFDLGLGYGLDYGGLYGIKVAYTPNPYVSIFGSGGYVIVVIGESFNVGWGLGAIYHFVPVSSATAFRPFAQIMYGVNGGVTVEGYQNYDRSFIGVALGAGFQYRFSVDHENGFDVGINYPIRSKEFNDYIDELKNNSGISGFSPPWPIGFSISIHSEF